MPNVSSQVAAAHLEFIQPVSAALAAAPVSADQHDAARLAIAHYRESGWTTLCEAVEARLAGRSFGGDALEEEDEMILAAIERAATEPEWLDRVVAEAEAEAADHVAALILAATWGEREALAALNEMREAAQAAGVEGSTAHAFIAMVEGERQRTALVERHPNAQVGLVEATLAALTRRERDAG